MAGRYRSERGQYDNVEEELNCRKCDGYSRIGPLIVGLGLLVYRMRPKHSRLKRSMTKRWLGKGGVISCQVRENNSIGGFSWRYVAQSISLSIIYIYFSAHGM